MSAAAPLAWNRFAPILAVQFIGTLGYSIALPFLVFLVTDFGGAAWTYGLVGATYSSFQLVGAPLLGRWSDQAGRRPVLIASQGGTMVAWLLFLLALALPMDPVATVAGATLTVPLLVVFAARALDGLTGGNVSVASAYVADITVGNKSARKFAYGWMGMAASLGFVVGPALAGILGATSWGYRGPVAAAAFISGAATLLAFRLEPATDRCEYGPPDQPTITRVLGQEQRRCDRPVPRPSREVLMRPIILALLAATFIQFLAFNFFYAGFPVHANVALGWDAGRLGIFYAVLSAFMVLCQGPLLRLCANHMESRTLFVTGMLLLAASFVALAAPHPDAPFGAAVLFAMGNGLAWPTFQARLAAAAGDENQGAVQGAATGAGSAASILGLIAGGMLYPWLEVWLFVAGGAIFVLVAAGTPIWFGRRGEHP